MKFKSKILSVSGCRSSLSSDGSKKPIVSSKLMESSHKYVSHTFYIYEIAFKTEFSSMYYVVICIGCNIMVNLN